MDGEGGLMLADSSDGVTGVFWCRVDEGGAAMERFVRNLQRFAQALTEEPEARVAAILLI